MQRDALGLADLVPVVIDHPLSTLTEAEIEARAAQAAPQCVAVWRGENQEKHDGQRGRL